MQMKCYALEKEVFQFFKEIFKNKTNPRSRSSDITCVIITLHQIDADFKSIILCILFHRINTAIPLTATFGTFPQLAAITKQTN